MLMRPLQKITPAQIRRAKTAMLSLSVGLEVQLFAQNVAEAKIEEKAYKGPYHWDG